MQGCFPEAEKDPVIQIASMVTVQGQSSPIVRNVLTLNSCAPIVGAEVMSFSKEEDLLRVRALCQADRHWLRSLPSLQTCLALQRCRCKHTGM